MRAPYCLEPALVLCADVGVRQECCLTGFPAESNTAEPASGAPWTGTFITQSKEAR